ncbi:MAG TPA: DNA repair protein RecO, partial [Eubacteriaceae bacterium]|nr:DNA repair protein RecO [Eubacteriaceae bacterium]
DKIITIFSKEQGKFSAMVKGAKNPKSIFVASTQLFCYSSFIFYTGRNLAYINQAEVINSFHKLRNDYRKLSMASYFAEVIHLAYDDYQQEETALRMTLNLLYFLSEDLVSRDENIVISFQLKLMNYLGQKPTFGKDAASRRWLISFDGYSDLSGEQKRNGPEYALTEEEARDLKTLQELPLQKLKRSNVVFDRSNYIMDVLNRYMEYHLSVRSKTFFFVTDSS